MKIAVILAVLAALQGCAFTTIKCSRGECSMEIKRLGPPTKSDKATIEEVQRSTRGGR